MNISNTHQKYHELITAAESAGVTRLHVRELNNILYIDGQVPSETVMQQIWQLYQQIDPGYKSGDLVLNLQLAATAA